MAAFEALALYKSNEIMPSFDADEIEMAGFEASDILLVRDHPLMVISGEKYQFVYDFLPQYLKAFYLAKRIRRVEMTYGNEMWELMAQEANGKGHVLDHLGALLDADAIDDIGSFYRKIPRDKLEARSFAFHLIQSFLDRISTGIKDRTLTLFSLIEGKDFRNKRVVKSLYVVGRLDRLDLSDIIFEGCTFMDVNFSKCDANAGTVFNRCKFAGELDFSGSDEQGWSDVSLVDPVLVPPANLVWSSIRQAAADSGSDEVEDAMRLALGKFWRHGRLKATLSKKDWHRGSLGHTVYCKSILAAMLKVGVLEGIHISGVAEGGYNFSRKALPDLQRFMDNRQLTGQLREVYERLLGR